MLGILESLNQIMETDRTLIFQRKYISLASLHRKRTMGLDGLKAADSSEKQHKRAARCQSQSRPVVYHQVENLMPALSSSCLRPFFAFALYCKRKGWASVTAYKKATSYFSDLATRLYSSATASAQLYRYAVAGCNQSCVANVAVTYSVKIYNFEG